MENKLQYGCNLIENKPSIYQFRPKATEKSINFSRISAIECTDEALSRKLQIQF